MGSRPKTMPLQQMLQVGLVQEGDLLRFLKGKEQLLAIGRVRTGGIEVPGVAKLLGFSAFEAHAGSKLHRPCEYTFTPSGLSLQELIINYYAETMPDADEATEAEDWGLTDRPRSPFSLPEPQEESESDLRTAAFRCCACNQSARLPAPKGDAQVMWVEPAAAEGSPPVWTGADVAGAQPALLEMQPATFISLGFGRLPRPEVEEPSPRPEPAAARPVARPPPQPKPRASVPVAPPARARVSARSEAAAIAIPADAGEYLQLVQAVRSREQLFDTLKLHFPPFPAGNNAEARPLRSLFASLVPKGLWNGRIKALEALTKVLWTAREQQQQQPPKQQQQQQLPVQNSPSPSPSISLSPALASSAEADAGHDDPAAALDMLSTAAEAVQQGPPSEQPRKRQRTAEPEAPADDVAMAEQPEEQPAPSSLASSEAAHVAAPVATETVPQVDGAADADTPSQLESPADVSMQPAESAPATAAATKHAATAAAGDDSMALPANAEPAGQPAAVQVDEKHPAQEMPQQQPDLTMQDVKQAASSDEQIKAELAEPDSTQSLYPMADAAVENADAEPQGDGRPVKAEAANQPSGAAVNAQPDTEPIAWHWQLPAALSSSLSSNSEAEALVEWPQHPEQELHAELQEDRGPYVACACCLRRWHTSCLPAEAHAQDGQRDGQQLWCSAACRRISHGLALVAAAGLLPSQGLPATHILQWQLIRSCAVSSPQDCQGCAPQYPAEVTLKLRANLAAARHLLAETCTPLADSRTGRDLVPLLLQGAVHGEQGLDCSTCHTALLWGGSSLLCAGVIRVLGEQAAEVILMATRPECRGNGFGSALLAAVEQLCSALGVQQLVVGAAAAADGQPQEAEAASTLQQEAMQDAHAESNAERDSSAQVPKTEDRAAWHSWLSRRGYQAARLPQQRHLPLLWPPSNHLGKTISDISSMQACRHARSLWHYNASCDVAQCAELDLLRPHFDQMPPDSASKQLPSIAGARGARQTPPEAPSPALPSHGQPSAPVPSHLADPNLAKRLADGMDPSPSTSVSIGAS